MLPELLFTVGNSMQDVSRDDFGLLNGGPFGTNAGAASATGSMGSGAAIISDKDAVHLLHNHLLHHHPHQPHVLSTNHSTQPPKQQHQQLQHNHHLITGTDCTLEHVKLSSEHDATSALLLGVTNVKLEEPENVYEPWHASGTSHSDIDSNLLCHSVDPLISGAIDDNLHEFHPNHPHSHHPNNASASSINHHHQFQLPAATVPISICPPIKSEADHGSHHASNDIPHSYSNVVLPLLPSIASTRCESPQTTTCPPFAAASNARSASATAARKKPARTRRKGQLKLRFHHQALPQEYLEHYEATQQSQLRRDHAKAAELASAAVLACNSRSAINRSANRQRSSTQQDSPMPAEVQRSVAPPAIDPSASRAHDSVRSWLQKISEYQHETPPDHAIVASADLRCVRTPPICDRPAFALPAPATLVHPKTETPSRRSANARIVSYSDLPFMGEMTLDNSKPRRGRKPKKADICHLIYKNYGTILPGTPRDLISLNGKNERTTGKCVPEPLAIANIRTFDEPLNLCLRDRSTESFTIVSSDGDDDDTDAGTEHRRPATAASSITTCTTDTDSLLTASMKMSLPNFHGAMLDASLPSSPSTGVATTPSTPSSSPFVHPSTMAMYYKRIVDAASSAAAVNGHEPVMHFAPVSTSSLPFPATAQLDACAPPHYGEPIAKILIPKNISDMLKQQQHLSTAGAPSPSTSPGSVRPPSTSPSAASSATAPKRKRSAIFIPPMPVESPNGAAPHHATEVSICKFKFTGGAKPSLQEKKMLSVDAGGNFRYYSGTGDKSMRGYEFFPRETLQQSGAAGQATSAAGAFLSAAGERIAIDPHDRPSNVDRQFGELPPTGAGHLAHLPPTVNVGAALPALTQPLQSPNVASTSSATTTFSAAANGESRPGKASASPVRRSRRSIQREKLEKTFKEKGFLIQTQQLESAEGATYCKFRQLRKFTRYLFRSWKDYLPGDVQQQAAAVAAVTAAAQQHDGEPDDDDEDVEDDVDASRPSDETLLMLGGRAEFNGPFGDDQMRRELLAEQQRAADQL